MCLALEDELENLVKAEMRSTWPEAKTKWFVQNHQDAWDLRKPGKMKKEWESSTGSIIW